jgi:hypothetical protein
MPINPLLHSTSHNVFIDKLSEIVTSNGRLSAKANRKLIQKNPGGLACISLHRQADRWADILLQ